MVTPGSRLPRSIAEEPSAQPQLAVQDLNPFGGLEPYYLRHLAAHLEEAGRVLELHQLLLTETKLGHNAWYSAKEAVGATAAYIADLARGWQLSIAAFPHPEEVDQQADGSEDSTCAGDDRLPRVAARSSVVLLQVRYALMITSLHSFAKNVQANLIAALVQHNLWTSTQALAYAQQTPDPFERVRTVSSLLSVLSPALVSEALTAALSTAGEIEDEQRRAWALAALAPHLLEAQRESVLAEMLTVARMMEDNRARAWALTAFAPHLPEAQRESVWAEALTAARAITDYEDRVRALVALAPHLAEPQRESVLAEGLTVARAITEHRDRAHALATLAPHLSKSLVQEALTMALDISDERRQAIALGALVPRLAELRQPEAALALARAIMDYKYRARALAALAPHLPKRQHEPVLAEALTIAQTIKDERERAATLDALVRRLAELAQPEAALAAAQAIGEERRRAGVLVNLAPHLSEALLRVGLDIARAMKDEGPRGWALAALVLHLPKAQREPVLIEILDTLQTTYRSLKSRRSFRNLVGSRHERESHHSDGTGG